MNNGIKIETNTVSFEEFSKIDLRIGRIISVESIPKFNKVYKSEVDLGFEKRIIIVGAAPHYKPEELEGRLVIVCSNLTPKKNREHRIKRHDVSIRWNKWKTYIFNDR